MKILHTSDWHIGKKLMGRDRLQEQNAVLNELIKLCDQEKVELILIAGDIFDTFLPSSEAENLFFEKIKILAGENRAVVIISGNHDDSLRLSACTPLAEELGIYIVGKDTILPLNSTRLVHPIVSGKGYCEFSNEKGERVYLNLLPYPTEARFREEKNEEGYLQQISEWIQRGEKGNTHTCPSIFVSHLFLVGGSSTEGERDIDLGGAKAVPLDLLPDSDYVALGHLHKKQQFGHKNIWYSGSLLEYSFDEAGIEKGCILFDAEKDGVKNVKFIPFKEGKKLVRLQANDLSSAMELLKNYQNNWVELTLHLTEPLTGENTKMLSSYQNLAELIPDIHGEGDFTPSQNRKKMNPEQLFDAYYTATYGTTAPDKLKKLFLSFMQEEEK